MKVYSYVVARDYGFAPNPFVGVCTLATCKPNIREAASVGDWIVGTGSIRYGLAGRLVYAMQIDETLTFDDYWNDPRFRAKRPNLRGSLKQAFGDNIYHRLKTGRWHQEPSHHSLEDGRPNQANIKHDTRVPRVLIASTFSYWGASGPKIPKRFRDFKGYNVCCQHQGHKCNFPSGFAESFVTWLQYLGLNGYMGPPSGFGR